MKSWKTTVAGLIGALTQWLPQVVDAMNKGTDINWNVMLLGLVILILGVVAKDLNVSGNVEEKCQGDTTSK